ncbi:unnamed protein product [Mortierella alpina]
MEEYGRHKTMFRDVLDLCREVLSFHARERMIKEMDWAFMLTHSISNLGEAKQGCDASNEVEDAADLRRSSLERLLGRLDPAEVHAVYCVMDRVDRRKIEYVILLADHSYFCSCLLLQNSGLVCKHFFYLMQEYESCKFHLKLVRTRWFQDEALAVDNIDKFMGKQAFLVANCHNVDLQPEQRPSVSYLEDVRRMISEESAIPKPGKIEARKKRQYGELMGVAKSAISLAQDDQDSATRLDIMDSIEGVLNRRQKRLASSEGLLEDADEIKDPLVGKKVGRPRSSRKKAAYEKFTSKKKDKGAQ